MKIQLIGFAEGVSFPNYCTPQSFLLPRVLSGHFICLPGAQISATHRAGDLYVFFICDNIRGGQENTRKVSVLEGSLTDPFTKQMMTEHLLCARQRCRLLTYINRKTEIEGLCPRKLLN